MADSGETLTPSNITLKGPKRSSQHFEASELPCGLINGEVSLEDKVPDAGAEIVAGILL